MASARMRTGLGAVLAAASALLGGSVLAHAEAAKPPAASTVILSLSPRTVRWATVYKVPDTAGHDPYYHVEVIEEERHTPPWQFKRLAVHIVVTSEALERSRLEQKAKTYIYKDIEFRIAYQAWRELSQAQREAVVCRTAILECIGEPDSM
ncbi:DUF5086 domain-containing protein [Rhizobium leguminosarum bv. trifolii]|uniref:DUF5086 domain-containing protein n=1 Tax=Rhizobium leguminosarum bv. trifolii TaxID=386 RepID=A0A3E1B0E7_RHILT|nr:DUF5086 family protein [Rhizobium leguminosarum]RFB83206.1 DUF5086 domain-containing protein [Rhizobium leguminosarum bv. trifolii]RFB83581.1 DUF5086 domain-containing protein [Rhizobium leguminosarum bv. trifolii]